MAEALFEDFLTCPICLDPLEEPVTLGCHHSFCSGCINNSWDANPARICPVCRRRSSRESVEVNFALRELSRSYIEKKKVQEQNVKGSNAKESEVKEANGKDLKICSSHPDVPPLFCLDEARAVCPVCEFSLHSQHTVVTGDEAEERLKEQVQTQIRALKAQRQSYEELEKAYEQLQRHQEEQTVECVSQITDVFSRMQRVLKEEEEKALGALRAEQSRQTQTLDLELQKVRDQIAALTNSIQDLQKSTNTHSFFSARAQTYKAPIPCPQPKQGLLLNQAKILGNLGYRVWMKMKNLVTFSPVILDPNTAEGSMHLSQDLCGVRHGPPRALPVVPERFTNEPMVLGSVGFTSGQHQWDVEVGDLPTWDFGVVKKSVDRRGQIYAHINYGIWCLWHGEGRYDSSCGQTLTVKIAPKKIRVKLDYEKGELSFYDANNLNLLVTQRAAFTETLFPYVSVGPAPGAKTKEIRVSGKIVTDLCADLFGLRASRGHMSPPPPPPLPPPPPPPPQLPPPPPPRLFSYRLVFHSQKY